MGRKKKVVVSDEQQAILEQARISQSLLKQKEEMIKETASILEERPSKTVLDTTKTYPEAMCWRCNNFTPIRFTCKHCKEKNPHRDISKGSK